MEKDRTHRISRHQFLKIAAGGSAGGYLTLMTGFYLKPRPRALVSYFGYGDITTPWYSEPDAFYRRQPLVSTEDAYGCVGQPRAVQWRRGPVCPKETTFTGRT